MFCSIHSNRIRVVRIFVQYCAKERFGCSEKDNISASTFQNGLEITWERNMPSAAHVIKLVLSNSVGQIYARVENIVICTTVNSWKFGQRIIDLKKKEIWDKYRILVVLQHFLIKINNCTTENSGKIGKQFIDLKKKDSWDKYRYLWDSSILLIKIWREAKTSTRFDDKKENCGPNDRIWEEDYNMNNLLNCSIERNVKIFDLLRIRNWPIGKKMH